ncbi:hypothetical protein N0V84_002158 [Fusarium piperis]|uniref:gamma-glutamylcyclotransferase n=1 Tax=Fusarium piperis TaxID=1435070 RepID=A0A9W8WJM7_9HYPO|nr:hypothetical protein N0V84_002158 [Fusarium piperis]
MQPSTLPRARKPDVLYFAYGSNLHVAQMAQRCPSSVFVGTGTLSGYRWQINQRGVANVVPADDSSVEGLVYLVNARDVRALDRSEGVARKLYQKHMLEIVLQRHRQYSSFTSRRLAHVLAELPSPSDQPIEQPSQSPSDSNPDGPTPSNGLPSQRQEKAYHPLDVKALVYVSENYATDGMIREEYIARMQKAVSNAGTLGVSQSFLNKYIVPHLKSDEEEPVAPTQAQEKTQKEKQEEKQEDTKEEGKASESPDAAISNDTTTNNTTDEASVQAKENQEGQREGRFDAVIVGACVLATAGWCSMTLL